MCLPPSAEQTPAVRPNSTAGASGSAGGSRYTPARTQAPKTPPTIPTQDASASPRAHTAPTKRKASEKPAATSSRRPSNTSPLQPEKLDFNFAVSDDSDCEEVAASLKRRARDQIPNTSRAAQIPGAGPSGSPAVGHAWNAGDGGTGGERMPGLSEGRLQGCTFADTPTDVSELQLKHRVASPLTRLQECVYLYFPCTARLESMNNNSHCMNGCRILELNSRLYVW